jgi:BirA family transcriptional regulator, biotin operon repressor / biotin---[acetyl-CoA-carboxylase] ligase
MARYRLIEFAELDSTNRHARDRLRELADGDVIQAAVQTAGRGRRERRWISHLPGNLCLSLVLKPAHAAPADLPLVNLSQLLALAVCRALDSHHAHATLKWPNDVLVKGRKIAGMLAETVVQGSEFLGLVLGLGVNLNLDAAALAAIDQPATSLAVETGRPVDVARFRDHVLDDFFQRRDEFLKSGFGLVREDYLARCAFLGQPVEIRQQGEVITGMAQTITLDGSLELAGADGVVRQITIGEMFLGG